MLSAIANKQLAVQAVITPLDREFANKWLPLRELNMDYVHNMPKSQFDKPVLDVWLPDGTALLIDGSHRYMARVINNKRAIAHHIIAFSDWQSFAQIEGNLSDA